MNRNMKDFTIYVDVEVAPDVCVKCGSSEPMKDVMLPIPDSDPQSRPTYLHFAWVARPDEQWFTVKTLYWPTVHWDRDEDAWACTACGHVHRVPDDDGERVVIFPTKREVCGRCDGTGYHLTPSIGQHAYTMEEFRESFDDDEAEEYFKRGGIYDVVCERCHGRNVEDIVDREACARDPKLARDLALADEFWESEADARAESAAEMRMERMMCGDY